MPIFEYRCDTCGKAFEELVQSDTRVACPSCSATGVTRKFSVPARPVARAATAPAACESGFPQSSCCGGGCQPH